jgi:hypothetical protein
MTCRISPCHGLRTKLASLTSRSYQTQYQHNTANQGTVLIYPSGKRVRVIRDTRGRMSGLDKVDSLGNVLGTYMSGVGYNVAGQMTGLSLGNGVSEGYGYSADRLQLTSQTATRGVTTLMSLTYNYADLGVRLCGEPDGGPRPGRSVEVLPSGPVVNPVDH